jgi:ABC-2 type transport system ATP-binding protein
MAISVENLSKKFVVSKRDGWRTSKSEVLAVDSINFSVEQGAAIALIGPNGAGKSTTIKMLTGILHPTSGSATVLGLKPWRDRTRLAYQIGAVFGQRSQLWYHLPPEDTFELLSRIYNLDRAKYKKQRDLLIERFNLGPFLKISVRKLSLGQRMRAEIAASLLHQPQLLFLDEPTIGVDVVARQELRDLIKEWNKQDGVTVLITSHDAGDIEHVAERVLVVNHGQIVLDDKLSKMRRDYLGTKILSARFHGEYSSIDLPGINILKTGNYAMKLEVDTSLITIEKVVKAVLELGTIADISIEDPPLEEIIAHIYSKPHSKNGNSQ